mmetsp:Transcript_51299/g.133245  ORF Transcript_51299/g.133245 Transcript_51299/m.133245 type:complete len:338 (-) Transcript_51299:418-1431(-)
MLQSGLLLAIAHECHIHLSHFDGADERCGHFACPRELAVKRSARRITGLCTSAIQILLKLLNPLPRLHHCGLEAGDGHRRSIRTEARTRGNGALECFGSRGSSIGHRIVGTPHDALALALQGCRAEVVRVRCRREQSAKAAVLTHAKEGRRVLDVLDDVRAARCELLEEPTKARPLRRGRVAGIIHDDVGRRQVIAHPRLEVCGGCVKGVRDALVASEGPRRLQLRTMQVVAAKVHVDATHDGTTSRAAVIEKVGPHGEALPVPHAKFHEMYAGACAVRGQQMLICHGEALSTECFVTAKVAILPTRVRRWSSVPAGDCIERRRAGREAGSTHGGGN